jgi:hypothetical protein
MLPHRVDVAIRKRDYPSRKPRSAEAALKDVETPEHELATAILHKLGDGGSCKEEKLFLKRDRGETSTESNGNWFRPK